MTYSSTAVKTLKNWHLLQSRTVLSTVLGIGVKVEAVGTACLRAGEKHEEEDMPERSYHKPTTTPIPNPPVLHG